MVKMKVDAGIIKEIVDRNAHKLQLPKEALDDVSRLARNKTMEGLAQQQKRLNQLDYKYKKSIMRKLWTYYILINVLVL